MSLANTGDNVAGSKRSISFQVDDGSSNDFFFFFNDTATTEIYTLSLHDALPIQAGLPRRCVFGSRLSSTRTCQPRSEEHTSELQSRENLVCRLLLEKKKNKDKKTIFEKKKSKREQ